MLESCPPQLTQVASLPAGGGRLGPAELGCPPDTARLAPQRLGARTLGAQPGHEDPGGIDGPGDGSARLEVLPPARPAVMLTSYLTEAPQGRNLAALGYSYDFVAHAFSPLLQRWGQVIEVRSAEKNLEAEIRRARRRGLQPVHVGFRAFQHLWPSSSAPNVVVPAWEFPDVPDHAFDGDPRNDWVAGANRCSLVIVGGPFTARALCRAGVRTAIRIVQVPTAPEYFEVPRWSPTRRTLLDCPAYVFPQASPAVPEVVRYRQPARALKPPLGERLQVRLGNLARDGYKRYLRPWIPPRLDRSLAAAQKAWSIPTPRYRPSRQVELSGVVYTSIFTPLDGRKNWHDLLTGFLLALRDQEDATLVLKLITQDPAAVHQVLNHYRRLDLHHRCRVVVITGFLSQQQMLGLTEASTYYLTTTKAEGNCLPLMNYLAAGRPGISPCHTAIGDYFSRQMGYVVASHPEPTAWPQDRQFRCRTSWHRLVWPSLVEQIRASYLAAKQQRAVYEGKASAAQEKMLQWASREQVWPRLRAALRLVAPTSAAATDLRQRSAA
jgi:glycosyltransferase involved in cell wall biosynthesis